MFVRTKTACLISLLVCFYHRYQFNLTISWKPKSNWKITLRLEDIRPCTLKVLSGKGINGLWRARSRALRSGNGNKREKVFIDVVVSYSSLIFYRSHLTWHHDLMILCTTIVVIHHPRTFQIFRKKEVSHPSRRIFLPKFVKSRSKLVKLKPSL